MFTLSVVYRPPNSINFLSDFDDFLERTVDVKNHVITGDFNIHVDMSSDRFVSNFLNVLDHYRFSQHIDKPTHSAGHVLDLFLSRTDDNIIRTSSVHDLNISDHAMIVCDLSVLKSPPSRITVSFRKWKDVCLQNFESDLISCDGYQSLLSSNTVDPISMTDSYNLFLSSLADKHAPVITKSISPRPFSAWFDRRIIPEKKKRRRLERIWRRTRDARDRENFVNQRNRVTKLVFEAKQAYYTKLVSDNSDSPSSLWMAMNSLLCRHPESILPSHDSPTACAELFSEYFVNKINTIRDNFPPSCDSPPSNYRGTCLSTFSIATTEEITEMLRKIKPKSCSLDPIPTNVVKQLHEQFSHLLCKIVNASFSTGVVPVSEKRAVITPLLKKNGLDKEHLGNYRPVSCLTFLSKLIERLVARRVYSHLRSNSLLSPQQSAYRPGYSTETALSRFHNDLACAINNGKVSCVVLLDLSAAFDTVDHSILINRLQRRFGFSGTVLEWFKSYMTDRTQSVQIKGHTSRYVPLVCGVPQGSVLGPLLYSMYTTPIHDIISSYDLEHQMYADDTNVYVSFFLSDKDKGITTLELCLQHLYDWFNTNRLKLNPEKTEVFACGTRQRLHSLNLPSVNVCGEDVTLSSSARSLGVFFDSSLSFDFHISSICKKSFLFLRNLYRIRPFIDDDTCKLIVCAFIFSVIDYCNSILIGCKQTTLNRLQRVQNSCARFVKRLPRFAHISTTLSDLHWLPIRLRIEYKVCCLAHKCIHGDAPDYLKNLLAPAHSSAIATVLRSQNAPRLHQPLVHVTAARGAFSIAAPSAWNELPPDLRRTIDFSCFKKSLKTYFFSKL